MLNICAFSRFSNGFPLLRNILEKNAVVLGYFHRETAIISHRSISSTPISRVKEIRETVTENAIVVEGVTIESEKKDHLLVVDGPPNACPLCRLNLDLQHTDVLILSQFVESNGNMLSRRVTGLCEKQQKLMSSLVDQAKKAGLMPNHVPPWFDRSKISKKFAWRKFNRYFVPEKNGSKTKRYR